MKNHLAIIGLIFVISGTLALSPTRAWAATDDNSYVNYDNIVNELKASADETPKPTGDVEDPTWEEVAIHGGAALATSWVAPTAPSGISGSGLMLGMQFDFGMNLFSKVWRAEGAFGSYTQSQIDPNLKVSLKEFEMRFVYLPELQEGYTLRMGTGIAARYMSLSARANGQWADYETSTPAAIFLLGVERKIAKSVSLGPDFSYHSTLISDTFDRSAWNAIFHLTATF